MSDRQWIRARRFDGYIETVDKGSLILVRMNPGDDVLSTLQEMVRNRGVTNGLIISGIGSVSSHHYHVVSSPTNPPEEIFVKAKAPADVINMNGMILDGRVHTHISFSNDKTSYGGHLEPGTIVLTFLVVAVVLLENSLTSLDAIGSMD